MGLATCLHQLLMEVCIELEVLVPLVLLLWLLLMHLLVIHVVWILLLLLLLEMISAMIVVALIHLHHTILLLLMIDHFILIHIAMEVVVVTHIGSCINQIWILKKIHLWIDWSHVLLMLLVVQLVHVVDTVHLIHTNIHRKSILLHHASKLVVAIGHFEIVIVTSWWHWVDVMNWAIWTNHSVMIVDHWLTVVVSVIYPHVIVLVLMNFWDTHWWVVAIIADRWLHRHDIGIDHCMARSWTWMGWFENISFSSAGWTIIVSCFHHSDINISSAVDELSLFWFFFVVPDVRIIIYGISYSENLSLES